MSDRLPNVAPFDACVGCLRGDVTTMVVAEGDTEWHVVTLMKLARLTMKEAAGVLRARAEEEGLSGFPTGRWSGGFLLCPECARRTGATIVEKAAVGKGGRVTGYVQPEDFFDDPDSP